MELISGKTYFIKINDQFCHLYTRHGNTRSTYKKDSGNYIFVGNINTPSGDRNIFWSDKKGYLMMGGNPHTYVIDTEEEISDIKSQIDKLQERLEKLTAT